MSRRSTNRNIYEARMTSENQAALLVASPHRKHQKVTAAYAKLGAVVQNKLAEPTQETLAEA